MRSRITKIGIPQSKSQSREDKALAVLNGMGPSGGLSSSEIASDKPIERLGMNDPKYSENFVNRFLQKFVKKESGS
jgi:hypothetical protein